MLLRRNYTAAPTQEHNAFYIAKTHTYVPEFLKPSLDLFTYHAYLGTARPCQNAYLRFRAHKVPTRLRKSDFKIPIYVLHPSCGYALLSVLR